MTVPSLGFGTAPMLGRIDRRRSLRALSTAYASGIRHFDTARSYGWGECEALLGGFLGDRPRESYTLVSKCGLVPARRSNVLSGAKQAARQIIKWMPAARGLVQRVVSTRHFQPIATYEVEALRNSVETSLRELRTGYLDVLILHNFEPGTEGLHDVLEFFRELREQGRIKRFGFSLSSDLHAGLEYLAKQNALSDAVVQVPVTEQLVQLSGWHDVRFIAHSPFQYLKGAHAAADATALRGVLNKLSSLARCEALVTSMFSEEHIRQNLSAHSATLDDLATASGGVASRA